MIEGMRGRPSTDRHRTARWLVSAMVAAAAVFSSWAILVHAGSGKPTARYVGTAPDMCPYVSADQVAAVTGNNVRSVKLQQQPDAGGGRGCFYNMAAGQMAQPQHVQFSYFRGIGEPGFERTGEFVPGLGVKAIWGADALTVLTRQNDVVTIVMATDNGDAAQAQQIFNLAAPKLRAASAPAPFTPAQLRFLAWYNAGGDAWIYKVGAAIDYLAVDLTHNRAAVHRDALALQSAVATAQSHPPSPIDAADYKAAITDAAGMALDALHHVRADKLINAANTHMAAFSAAEQHEFAAMNSG